MKKTKEDNGYAYTRVELVKIAYMATVVARRQMDNISKVVSSPLPKKLYNERKSHRNDIFITSKIGRERKPKYIKMFDVLLKAQQNYQKAQTNFEGLAKNLTLAEQNEIMGGFTLPVNVTADK